MPKRGGKRGKNKIPLEPLEKKPKRPQDDYDEDVTKEGGKYEYIEPSDVGDHTDA